MICVGDYNVKFNWKLLSGQQNLVSEFKLLVFRSLVQATVHGVTKSRTQLSDFTHTHTHMLSLKCYTQTVEAGFVVELVIEMILFF